MTDYLRLAQERAPQAQDEQENPYLPIAREQQNQQQNLARTVIETALKDDPDLAAERQRLAQTSGIPADVVRRNVDELRVKERARSIDLINMAQESPVLYRQLTDPNFATTSIDDLDTLKNLERAVGRGVRYVKNDLLPDLGGAAVDLGLAATAGVGELIYNTAAVVNDTLGLSDLAQGARQTANRSRDARNSFGLQAETSTGQAVKSGLQSAGTNLALLPLGLERGLFASAESAATAVAGLMATGVGADAYMTAREQGKNRLEAAGYAVPQAGFEFIFERIPASKLFGDLATNTSLLKTLGKQAISEGWTEQVTTLAQDFNEWVNLNPSKTLAEFVKERPDAAYQTFIATLVGVGVQTSAIRGINKIVDKASNTALQFDQDLLQEQMHLAAASMLRQRSPEQFRTHVQRVVDENEGAKSEIYIDGEVLNQLAPELLAQLPESVREALPAALETNSTVAIPMADVLTIAPGTDLEQVINDNARLHPTAASRVEAQLTEQYLQQEAERVLAQAADTAAWQQDSDTVKATILDQLNTAGRFSSDVNEAYATLQANFFSTMAARTGMTPQELYSRFSLKVAAQDPDGEVLDTVAQRSAQTDTPEFKNWFGESKVVDASGKPLVVYHGTGADITAFDKKKSGAVWGADKSGFFFSSEPATASEYADFTASQTNGAANVVPVYVSLNNPLTLEKFTELTNGIGLSQRHGSGVDALTRFFDDERNLLVRYAKQEKNDGILLEKDGKQLVVAFDPNQIKSAVGNSGAFNPNDPSILNQGPRGTFNPQTMLVTLSENADLSTFLHESAHFFLEVMADLSSQPNAPQQIAEDMGRVLEWFGVPDLATWNGYTLDQKREHHERFAESFEQYLFEGKAPSAELQPLFRRFRAWMINVYRSLTAFMHGRNLNMSDEIRQVFSRLIATDEQIAQAEEAAGMLPDFDATNEAIERMQARSLRDLKWAVNARNKRIKALQKEAAGLRKEVEAEVRAEVDDMPEFQAKDAFDRASKNGLPSDEQLETIAAKYGYTSASEMMRAIDTVGDKAATIEGLTDQRMLERHGDLASPEAIEQAANEAIHNDVRARMLATELKGQADALNPRQDTGSTDVRGRSITVNGLVAAAKGFAENMTARRKVKDLKNAAWQHRAAEARAGKRWQQLTAEGDTAGAVQAKRDQMLNNYAAKAMQDAQTALTKQLDYLKKFDKESIRKKLPVEYLDQIDALLENMDLRVSTTGRDIERRASLRKWVESQRAIGLDPIVPEDLMDDAQRVSYKEMTVEELRGMVDAIRNIEHLGRLKGKLLAAKDKREFDAAAEAWAAEIRDNGGKPKPVKLEGDSRVVKFFKGAWADHRKLNSLIRQMGGGADNSEGFKLLIRSMNERGTVEDVMIENASIELAKIHAPVEALPGGFSGAKLYIPEIRNSLSRAGRLAVALNWGNQQNRQRVRDGDAWTDGQVDAILRTLSPVELKFVNDVWEYLDSYWPDIKAKQERVSGVVEDKVEAEPFSVTASDGTVVQMRGGYYPIKYDGDRSLKSQKQEAEALAKDMLRGAILRPTTRRGHTQARVDEVVGRPVKKDLSVITQHVTQVAHDLAWHEWSVDAVRLLNDPRIAGAIRDHYGAETHRTMTDAVEAIVVGDVAKQTDIDRLLLAMRSNVTRSIMGASLTTAMLQPFGLTQSMARIGIVPVLKGAARWAGDAARMESTVGWVTEKSEFMRLRSKTFNRDLREISQRVRGKSKFAQIADASLFMLMQKMQMVADVPTWVGRYEKALNEGADEALAIQLADEAVLASQGGGNTRDLAAVQRDHPFLTQFYSYFNTTLQLVAESTAKTDFKNPRAAAGWLGDMVLLAVIPGILPALITYLLKGGGEDDEPKDWAKRLAEWQASYMLGMFVGLRELPTLWSPFDYGGPPAGKLVNDGRRLVQQANQGEIDDQAVLATIGFLGTAFGLPTTQLVRSYKGWKAWDEGDAPVSSMLFGPPPKD